MPTSNIVIRGAREHNLRDVSVDLPRNRLICLTGVSGSGKSSLAFDTLYAEGQRRYVESLSSFARQFLGQMPKPDVDLVAGLSPSISISQKSSGTNPRSTVGTITEISDYLRVLYARIGQGHCPDCEVPIAAQTLDQIVAIVCQRNTQGRITILAPLVRGQKGQHRDLLEDLRKQGFVRARINGDIVSLAALPDLDRQRRHDIEVVIDRLEIQTAARARVAEAVELAARLGKGSLMVVAEPLPGDELTLDPDDAVRADEDAAAERSGGAGGRNPVIEMYSTQYACPQCGQSFEPPSPQLFSFNSPRGMCLECSGLGEIFTFDPQRLINAPQRSLHDGCCELLGKWSDLGRWRRHIFQGVADTMERIRGLTGGTLLQTPWEDLDPTYQRWWLWGTGGQHITFTWRGGSTPMKYGGLFEGIIPELIGRYRGLKSAAKRRQLEQYMATVACGACGGQRLNRQACGVRLASRHPRFATAAGLSLPRVGDLSILAAHDFFGAVALTPTQQLIAADALKEVQARLGFLLNVGLDYLTLNRTAPTLSGGESQRIRLASQIGSGLVGVLYVLDEPSIGLHARDNDRLIGTLKHLRDLGNTVVVVEHDEETIRAADWVIDFGPGPGIRGGHVVAQGSPAEVARHAESRTGRFLAGIDTIPLPTRRRTLDPQRALRIVGARQNNLKNVDVRIPLGGLVCVTGVSGSGKSSLVNDILMESLREDLNHGIAARAAYERIEGLEHLDKLIAIDQSPIGRTPRSNPGTYIKLFDEIRNLYAKLPESKRRGFKSGRFSFNVGSGRCQACEGNGANKLEMDFLADLWITCPVCEGQRFNRETLQVKYNGKSIADVLAMEVAAALPFFENVPKIYEKLKTLHAVGLDYLQIGQPSPTLSGGEAQRIKLAREFVKRSTGRTLYVMDEPTTGLHFADIKLLLEVLQQFVAGGNTVLVVEHNLDVIKTADWVIDIGPEGGEGGGTVVCEGPPEQIAACAASYTGRALRRILEPVPRARSLPAKPGRKTRPAPAAPPLETIAVRGASQHSLRAVDVDLPREKMTVFCGPSGSGKSSLAMDTIYAEGQRRYVESLSSYARQFVNQMQKPRVDQVSGLSPAIAIEQKNVGNTPRSTVGTVTEVYDFFRVLFARLGVPHCPACNLPVGTQTADQIVDKILAYGEGTRLYLLAPLDLQNVGSGPELWEDLRAQGYQRIRINRQTYGIDEAPLLDRRQRIQVEIVVDRAVVRGDARARIADSVETALSLGKGNLLVALADEQRPESDWPVHRHSQHLACSQCGTSLERLAPHHFSFNSQLGWCPECEGLGQKLGADPRVLLRSPEATLAEGAVALWPDPNQPLAKAMLAALGQTLGIPLDRPFSQLDAAQRRALFYGSGPRSIAVAPTADFPGFTFQFHGLFNALEDAARLVAGLRARLSLLVTEVDCGLCFGSRLRPDAAAVRFRNWTMDALGRMPLARVADEVRRWTFDPRETKIAGEILREIGQRVQFLVDVGLDYLTLGRGAATLSNGEAQRIRLASQLGSGLCGVLYVLDEPTVGLHPRDNRRLLGALHRLRDLGNTLIVVEHDREVIAQADEVCDFGPGAGTQGGMIVAQAPPGKLAQQRGSVTGPYLSGTKAIPIPEQRRPVLRGSQAAGAVAAAGGRKRKSRTAPPPASPPPLVGEASVSADYAVECLRVWGAQQHNLKNIDVAIPLGVLTAITGPSGCGKSSLLNDIVYNALARRLHRANSIPGAHRKLEGLANINKVIQVDQSPLGNSPSSNPATYTGVFDLIRELYAHLPDARVRGYSARRFSFNVPGGRCEACEGNGQIRIEMHFLPDVWVQCEVCRGRRYNEETLAVRFQGHSIHDVLEMTAASAANLFANVPKIQRIVQTLCDVGLDYVRLGQSAPTLSGGEAQRVKLAAELSRPDTGRTLYLLDEPTTGLHFDDLAKLLEVLHRLVDLGNSVVVIEHNLDLIKHADWLLDLGPEAGAEGGRLVVAGTPEMVADYALAAAADSHLSPSHTGTFLREVLERDPRAARRPPPATPVANIDTVEDFRTLGKDAAMPWQVDGRWWHTQTRVGRDGQPARWEGELLARVVDFIQNHGEFAETNWGERSVVEITGRQKSQGWFLHALTGENWLLKLRFRVRRSTFRADALRGEIQLKTLNELDEVPRYSNASRIQVSALPAGWQQVEIQAFSLAELDQPSFWQFIEKAIASYQEKQQRVELQLEDQTPWAKLGKTWHVCPRGFDSPKRPLWEGKTLLTLFHQIAKLEPAGTFTWNNKQVVHFFVPQQQGPWLSIQTKKCDAIWLQLNGPTGTLGLGAVTEHFPQATLSQADRVETIRIPLTKLREVRSPQLKALLQQHLGRLRRN